MSLNWTKKGWALLDLKAEQFRSDTELDNCGHKILVETLTLFHWAKHKKLKKQLL